MRRKLMVTVAAAGLLVTPLGGSWAQTTTTSSTTTTTAATTTTTTLPICVPWQTPPPVIGENCHLPGIECFTLNPPAHCPPQEPRNDGDGGVVVVVDGPATEPGPAAQPVRTRIALTG